ncbi:hypothetical protein BDV27DRAFT_148090 [Aspergillus caelatus]|uniref:Zn(2)-C6 fungal-type domain-containing protein n=1 Tax=Aspergillus caelatus TaxID=61420 RepID=A0A5N6ZVY9_9EURO|nr:uncharacterized protein BDV27DRAFT_148090 [Aspergillus caelatus]KAE8361116.1 hypothetical protein BDV27DRAFT_148090 [Aspergillus caelatus]
MSHSTFKQYYLPQKEGFDSLTLREVPKAPPKYGQILVRIKAVSLNWRDAIIAIGTYPFPGPDALVPGSDGAGVVEAVGEGVTEWQPGDRVLANFTQDHLAGRLNMQTLLTQLGGETQGLLGEYFIFPKTGVVRIPDYLSFEEASCLPCAALTAWNALYGLTPLRTGQTVLLQGTGGVSIFALQIAHAAGATTVVTSSSDAKLAKAKQLGATHTINYRTNSNWAAQAKQITNGRGVDHIIEVGGTLTLQGSFDAIAMHGIIHCIGHITNPDPLGTGKDLRGPDAAFLALDRLCIVRGVVVGSREQFQEMLECFETSSIRPVIDRTFGFEEPVRRRNGSKHDKTGCLTCRYRRKKCVHNTFPVCGDCRRLNLECIREPARRVLPIASHPTADGLSEWKSSRLHDNVENAQRRSAMNFYITTLSQLCHLAVRENRYRYTALEARSRALRSLARSLRADGITAGEINAATSLVLMTSEVCLGCHTEWYRHLNGVKHIIMSTSTSSPTSGAELHGPEALKQSSEGQWILRNFAYHDILGSVTLGKQPLIESYFLQGLTDRIDTYIGVAFDILLVISDISSFDEQRLVLDSMRPSEIDASVPNCFSSTEQILKSWVCPPGTNRVLASLAYAYGSSALIYLYRRTLRGLRLHGLPSRTLFQDGISGLRAAIQAEISSVLQHTANIPVSGIVESALLFPLFIAGGEATYRSHIEVIRFRMKEMLSKRNFNNIQRALGLLEQVWEQRNAVKDGVEDYDVDWRDVVDRQEGDLLLT